MHEHRNPKAIKEKEVDAKIDVKSNLSLENVPNDSNSSKVSLDVPNG